MNDRERTRKYASSGTYVDLCDRCFSTVAEDIPDVEGEVPDDSDYPDEEDFGFGPYGSGENYND